MRRKKAFYYDLIGSQITRCSPSNICRTTPRGTRLFESLKMRLNFVSHVVLVAATILSVVQCQMDGYDDQSDPYHVNQPANSGDNGAGFSNQNDYAPANTENTAGYFNNDHNQSTEPKPKHRWWSRFTHHNNAPKAASSPASENENVNFLGKALHRSLPEVSALADKIASSFGNGKKDESGAFYFTKDDLNAHMTEGHRKAVLPDGSTLNFDEFDFDKDGKVTSTEVAKHIMGAAKTPNLLRKIGDKAKSVFKGSGKTSTTNFIAVVKDAKCPNQQPASKQKINWSYIVRCVTKFDCSRAFQCENPATAAGGLNSSAPSAVGKYHAVELHKRNGIVNFAVNLFKGITSIGFFLISFVIALIALAFWLATLGLGAALGLAGGAIPGIIATGFTIFAALTFMIGIALIK